MNKGKKEKKDKKEKLDEMADTAADVTDSILYGVEVASHAVEAVTTIAVPFAQFIPLIRDVTDILNKVTDLYRTAQHNKNITEVLMERIAAANSAVQILQAREDFFNSKDYTSLQRLVQVLQKMKKYIEEITQFSTVQKFLGAKSIERQYKELCNDYDSSISLLNFTLTVGFKIDSEKEDKILKEDIEELLKFQTALAESIADVGEKITSVDEKIVGANDKVEFVIEKVNEMQNTIEKVSEMQITMQNLMNNQKNEKGNQDKIDIIFNESLLPFEDYEEADEPPRSDRLRKFIYVKTKLDFAFKLVDKENYNTVKNQVTILKKLKDCQNIIQFYGLTHDGSNYHLVTEWAENRTLREFLTSNAQDIDMRLRIRIRIAYDIAKGLNFINSVGIVHRDIRSENIVITNYEVAKITNFKFSRKHNTATNNLSANKECIVYTAPELLKRITEAVEKSKADEEERRGENKKYDTKCEVYSFGILLWEIAECKIPYEQFDDFMEISKNVLDGYREPFTNPDIPDKYQNLVHDAVDPNPGLRPMFSKMLIDLQDVYKNGHSNGRKPIPVRRMSGTEMIDWSSFNYLSIDKAVEEHLKNNMKKETLYKCFDAYANLDNPKAKYYKAYYISKGWSDLTCSQKEKDAIAVELFKEAADYGEDFPDAQLRYATMVMNGKGVKKNIKEAVKYLLKAAKNDNVVAMFSVSTYYFSQGQKELGNYYLIKAANRKHEGAIQFCKTNNINY